MTCRTVNGRHRTICLDSSLELRPTNRLEGGESGLQNFQLQPVQPVYRERPPPSLGIERLFQSREAHASPRSFSQLIYDLSQQLEGFELNAAVRIPVAGLGPGGSRMDTWTQGTLREHGSIAVLGVTFVGGTSSRSFPGAVFNVLGNIPIIAPFFRFRILRVFMNPSTRRLVARVEYLCIPINWDAHQEILDQLSLAPNVLRGSDYDLRQSLPQYAWQFAQIVERFLAEQARQNQAGGHPPVAPASEAAPRIDPLLDQAEIWVDGNFSNRSLSLLGLTVHFAELGPGQTHRLRVAGRLLSPTITVNGIQSIDFNHSRANLRLADGGSSQPLVMQLTLDPHSHESFIQSIRIPHYQSHHIFLEAISTRNPEDRVTLSLEQGFTLQNFAMSFAGSEPSFSVDSLDVRQMSFDGFGVHLVTRPGDGATLTNLHVTPGEGLSNVEAEIHGRASEITADYFLGNERRGHLDFQYLSGEGSFRVVGGQGQATRFELNGRFSTQMSELRLLARSSELQAYADTTIQEAVVRGDGTLTVWPFDSRILVQGTREPVLVEGHSGSVIFHQDPSLVARWSELRQNLGAAADLVDSHATIHIQDISFQVPRLGLQSHVEEGSGRPVLRIDDAEIQDIHIRGDLSGVILPRLFGRYYPVMIPEEATMRDAMINIHGLRDNTDETGRREIYFSGIEISGEESRPTFSLRDQRRCYGQEGEHYDRQHVHVSLGTFQLNPDERRVQLADIGEHFHIIARDLLHGGCLIVE